MRHASRGYGWILLAFVALTACGTTASSSTSGAAVGGASPLPGQKGCAASTTNAGAPAPRTNAAFAFDIDRRVMVLFGGVGLADTWTWDVNGWTQQTPSQSPPAQGSAAMAYDLNHHYMVLYEPGGANGTTPETWTWDGASWTEQHPTHTPPSRIEPAMSTDPSRGGVVLVGGTEKGDMSDVWAWDGSDWNQVLPDQGPVFGAAHAIRVSPKDGSILVAGNVGAYQFANGKWTSLGVPWPHAGQGYVGNVAFDVGGNDLDGFVRFSDIGETWAWRPGLDAAWSNLAPPCSPPARWRNGQRPAMAYDDWADVIVLFGGFDRNDTWTFNGTTWMPAAGGAAPPAVPSPSPVGLGTWTRLTSLATGRIDQTATVLRDGRVLVVGGSTEAESNQLASVEIFDPKTNKWSAAAPMAYPRARHTATLLADGRVLAVGGLGPGRGNAEIYDPTANSWSSAG